MELLQSFADVPLWQLALVAIVGFAASFLGGVSGYCNSALLPLVLIPITGPEPLVKAVLTAKQFLTFVSGAPFQPEVATGLRLPDTYFTGLRDSLRQKRDRLCEGLRDVGFDVYQPAGTYFVTADIRPLGYSDGIEFCRDLPQRCGVVAIPTQVFYDDVAAGKPLMSSSSMLFRSTCSIQPEVR